MPTKKKPTSYTITEAAKKLGVKRQAIHEAIKKGRLEAERGKITHTQGNGPHIAANSALVFDRS